MFKNLLHLLTALIGFVILLIVPNTANAVTYASTDLIKTENQPALQQVDLANLNVMNSSLQLAKRSSNSFDDHSGCSCLACTQGINQTSNASLK